jgi:large subunit ribosomal protein L10
VTTVNPRELTGNIAAAFGSADEVSAAKTLHEFMVDHPSLAFVGGLMSDQVGWRLATAAEVTALATLPSRQQLLGQLAGTVASPLRGFVNVLSGNLRGLVQVLQAAANAQA